VRLAIRKSFKKDAEKLPASTKILLINIIEKIESADKLANITSCKKIKGSTNAYRIRLGNYRIGFYFEDGAIELVRILNRKDIYKYFP
jgi:mRNA interferase RelE/StbE